jgi:hypothetical protein
MKKEYKKRKNKTSLNLLKILEKLSRIRGYCFARNSALVNFLYITERQIQKYLAQFREEGLIECFTVLEKGNWVRNIYLTELGKRTLKEHQKSSPPPAQNLKNDQIPIEKKSPRREKSSPPVTNRYIYINNKQHARARDMQKNVSSKHVVLSSNKKLQNNHMQWYKELDRFNIKDSLKIYLSTKYTIPQLQNAISCLEASTTTIHNPYGFLVKALEESWQPTKNANQRLEIEEKEISTKCQWTRSEAQNILFKYETKLPDHANIGIYETYVSISFIQPTGGKANCPIGYMEPNFPSIFEKFLDRLCTLPTNKIHTIQKTYSEVHTN